MGAATTTAAGVSSVGPRALAALLFEQEARTQQASRIVRDAAQPGFVGLALFAFGGTLGTLGRCIDLFAVLGLLLRLLQRTLHLRALRAIGVRLRRLLLRCLRWRQQLVRGPDLRPRTRRRRRGGVRRAGRVRRTFSDTPARAWRAS